jgi:hypothetical protein
MIADQEPLTAKDAKSAKERSVAADQRRKAQIGEEELVTDEHRGALIEEKELTAEVAEIAEAGINELSSVNAGMARTAGT